MTEHEQDLLVEVEMARAEVRRAQERLRVAESKLARARVQRVAAGIEARRAEEESSGGLLARQRARRLRLEEWRQHNPEHPALPRGDRDLEGGAA